MTGGGDEYDPVADAWGSVSEAYRVIRERAANGGPWWTPKAPRMQADLFEPRYPVGVPPEICSLFETLALEVAAGGWQRYSADEILHRIRWHHRVEKKNRAFKANNNWTAPLARWFLSKHPELPRFFELRERITDGYTDG